MQLQRQVTTVEMATLEQERARIAGDLHDDIGPILAAIKYRLGVVTPGTENDQKQLVLCEDHLNEAMVRLRQVTHNLLPAALERRGLVQAILDLVASTAQMHPLQIELIADLADPLTKEYEIHLYRLVQEGLANCIQHAAATRLQIKLSSVHRFVTLQILDNGIGISRKMPVDSLRGRGISGFRNRTTMLGGKFFIDSEPGKGTALNFKIPIT